jgi:hypothetical protein
MQSRLWYVQIHEQQYEKLAKRMNILRIGSKLWLKIHARELFTKFTVKLLTFEKKGADGEFASNNKKVNGRISGYLLG